jgi:hypothetical protein
MQLLKVSSQSTENNAQERKGLIPLHEGDQIGIKHRQAT